MWIVLLRTRSTLISVNSYRWGQTEGFVSNIFSSSPAKSHSSSRYSSHSPSIGIVSRKPMSREGLTNAYLKVDSTPSFKTYERRCSEPCHTSVQLSLQAFNDNRYNCKQAEEKQAKLSCTDDEIHQGRTWRRGSLDGFTFERRRNSCGFKDPVLSRFAEELMKADTSVPELLLFGSHQSSSTTGKIQSRLTRKAYQCGKFKVFKLKRNKRKAKMNFMVILYILGHLHRQVVSFGKCSVQCKRMVSGVSSKPCQSTRQSRFWRLCG